MSKLSDALQGAKRPGKNRMTKGTGYAMNPKPSGMTQDATRIVKLRQVPAEVATPFNAAFSLGHAKPVDIRKGMRNDPQSDRAEKRQGPVSNKVGPSTGGFHTHSHIINKDTLDYDTGKRTAVARKKK